MLDIESIELLREAAERLDKGFVELAPFDEGSGPEPMREVLLAVADRLKDNFPYGHPLYAGQMLKPPHAIARLAYSLAMWINPNNHALDGGRASSAMEKEAVAEIAAMFGWSSCLGHLCGGGTMANLEALWVAGQCRPDQLVVASEQAHYTHARIAAVLRLPFRAVGCDPAARMSVAALEEVVRTGTVGTVVVTLGTTATGSVDPLPEILDLRSRYGFRIHLDAAYGGYFGLAGNLGEAATAAFGRAGEADSIAIDPHKHGLQPYGCGCILFKEPGVGKYYSHDSPYTYFTSDDLHLGEISLECSRPGAAAVALWATQRLFPLVPGGEFAARLEHCRQAAVGLASKIGEDGRWRLAFDPDLDIVVWAPAAASARETSRLSRRTFSDAAESGLHLALASIPASLLAQRWAGVDWDQDHVTCLRSCLLKPEQLAWSDEIWRILDAVARNRFERHADVR